MATGFYYHSSELDAEEIIEKCVERLSTISGETTNIQVNLKQESPPAEFIKTRFSDDWVYANHTEEGKKLDVPYSDLNKKSKRKARKRLIRKRGQFFVIEAEVKTTEGTYPVSALVEIRGQASKENTEYYIEEFYQGKLDIGGNDTENKSIKDRITEQYQHMLNKLSG